MYGGVPRAERDELAALLTAMEKAGEVPERLRERVKSVLGRHERRVKARPTTRPERK
jgi:hypothetical protein